MNITKDTTIRELLLAFPGASSYFSKYGITCLTGGEPKWGTITDLAKKKGYTDEEISKFAEDLDRMLKIKRQNK